MAKLVRGEASESEEEETEPNALKCPIFASEISGEATESDEDVYEKDTFERTNAADSVSLLQRKLIENNVAIWKDINTVIRTFVVPASKQLLITDQMLIKSQVSMQTVSSSLNAVQGNMKQLHDKTKDIFTTNFIPMINMEKLANSANNTISTPTTQ